MLINGHMMAMTFSHCRGLGLGSGGSFQWVISPLNNVSTTLIITYSLEIARIKWAVTQPYHSIIIIVIMKYWICTTCCLVLCLENCKELNLKMSFSEIPIVVLIDYGGLESHHAQWELVGILYSRVHLFHFLRALGLFVMKSSHLALSIQDLEDLEHATCVHFVIIKYAWSNLSVQTVVIASIHEANILSKFMHINLPYLFGVCLSSRPSIVTSFHGFDSQTITVHTALYSPSKEIQDIVATVSWMDVLQQVCASLEHLHCYQSVIHNDLKCDNVVLASTSQTYIKVIIDFGKTCLLAEGKKYTLNEKITTSPVASLYIMVKGHCVCK